MKWPPTAHLHRRDICGCLLSAEEIFPYQGPTHGVTRAWQVNGFLQIPRALVKAVTAGDLLEGVRLSAHQRRARSARCRCGSMLRLWICRDFCWPSDRSSGFPACWQKPACLPPCTAFTCAAGLGDNTGRQFNDADDFLLEEEAGRTVQAAIKVYGCNNRQRNDLGPTVAPMEITAAPWTWIAPTARARRDVCR